jgi:predicted RNA-binding protein associated with RNAse of E/G family
MPVTDTDSIMVLKLNAAREEVWRYDGRILERTANSILLEAYFNGGSRPFHGINLVNGDRFLETYFFDRWYNIFEIHDRETDALKGWYCNVTYPAEFVEGRVSYVDLALDLLVYPDGRQLVLDEDEFAELTLSNNDMNMARSALAELQHIFYRKFNK